MPEIIVRFWAGAQRAAGHAEEAQSASSVGELRETLAGRRELAKICGVASFLVDGQLASDSTRLVAGAVVDVLPPFAGGSPRAMGLATDIEIRTQRATEWPDVRSVIDLAFAPEVNAGQLAEWVHGSAGWVAELSFVAVQGERIVGHVMLSVLPLATPTGNVAVLYLSPLSVDPSFQGRGIGGALVEHVLRVAATRSESFVVLEGSPRMYPKFGFRPASDFGIQRPSDLIPEPAFQLVTLPAYRPDLRGQVRYPDYFYEIDAVGP